MLDDKDDKIVEEHCEEAEKEAVETVDELMKEKADNAAIVRDNTAQIQIFVQNANFDNKSDFKQVLNLVNLNTGKDKKYNLRRMEDCSEFFSTCEKREYIALAIILSAFEIVPVGDYTNLKDILTEYLPDLIQTDKEGKEMYVQRANAYISLNIALSVIGGKIFITEDGRQCIGYGEGAEDVLRNMWIQFPDLRKPVISWLLRTNESFEYKTSFEVYQITGAFIRIITEDFQYAKRHVFSRLYLKPDNLGLIARLAQELLKDNKFRTDILNMVLKWAESESDWLWKSALLVCLHTYGADVDKPLQKAMIYSIRKRMFGFRNSDLRFIVLFARTAVNVRTIIGFAINSLYQSSNMRGKEALARIYLKMIRYGYYQVNKNYIDLPFVTCDSQEQIDNICVVLPFIMARYDMYCQLNRIMQAYLEEISDYTVSVGTLNHITAFFYVLTRENADYQKDVLLFLSELKGNIAQKIYDKLAKIYKGNGGEKK